MFELSHTISITENVVKVCDEPLRCLRCHEYGELVAVGNDRGTAFLVEFSENLAIPSKNDKALLTAVSVCLYKDSGSWYKHV